MSASTDRLLLYVHYNKFSQLDPHVIYQLTKLKPLFKRIIIISNSPLGSGDETRLKTLADKLIKRTNIGYDFAAWRDAMASEGFPNLYKFDSVTLMNDTCFGPMFDLADTYKAMEKQPVDFWGLTNHGESKNGMPKTDGPIPEHLQSYFIVFNKKLVQSQVFADFWQGIQDFQDVGDVVANYETQMTQTFRNSGFSCGVFFDSVEYREANGIKGQHNFSELEPYTLFDHQVPLIKVKSILNYNKESNKFLFDIMEAKSSYPLDLITSYLSKYDRFDRIDVVSRKILPVSANSLPKPNGKSRIAIHIHTYYVDILNDYLKIFDAADFKFDLFITTSLAKEKPRIIEIIKGRKNIKSHEVILCDNKGRDVVAWLQIFDRMKDYDIAAHFHTKTSRDYSKMIGEIWRHNIEDSLMRRANEIVASFEKSPELGIVINDMPEPFHYLGGLMYYHERQLRKCFKKLLGRMDLEHIYKDFFELEDDLMAFLVSYGNMFWYRPKALQPMSKIALKDEEIPEEPLKTNITVLHALERLPVYVAHASGFDFRIAQPGGKPTSGLIDNFVYNKAAIDGLYYSRLFMTARLFCLPFFAIKKAFRHIRDRK